MRGRLALQIAVVGVVAACGTHAAAAEDPDPRPGYFTKAQAQRGKALYNRHCLHCHGGPDLSSVNWTVGYRVGSNFNGGGRAPLGLTRKTSSRDDGRPKFPSVYYLFARIRESMP